MDELMRQQIQFNKDSEIVVAHRSGLARNWDPLQPAVPSIGLGHPDAGQNTPRYITDLFEAFELGCWAWVEQEVSEMPAVIVADRKRAVMTGPYPLPGPRSVIIDGMPRWIPPMEDAAIFPPLMRYLAGWRGVFACGNIGGVADQALTVASGFFAHNVMICVSSRCPGPRVGPSAPTWRYRLAIDIDNDSQAETTILLPSIPWPSAGVMYAAQTGAAPVTAEFSAESVEDDDEGNALASAVDWTAHVPLTLELLTNGSRGLSPSVIVDAAGHQDAGALFSLAPFLGAVTAKGGMVNP